jgi:hypothetical protein
MQAQIFPSAPYSQTPPTYVPPSILTVTVVVIIIRILKMIKIVGALYHFNIF